MRSVGGTLTTVVAAALLLLVNVGSGNGNGSGSGSGSGTDSEGKTSVSLVQNPCRPSEHHCLNGVCIALDRYCDGLDDCGDKSDEPRYCSQGNLSTTSSPHFTPCNRTYLGDVGRTYELEIRRPREDRLPFLCHLNFTAGGGALGDLVQLTFDTFTVGKFVSFTSGGCPDGHMSIHEQDRPVTGGKWCGSAWGYTVYYSETPSLNLSLQLDRLSQQGIGYNFDFKLSYKFLRRSEARLRYGNGSLSTWRGELQPGTYCDRILDDCAKRTCRIQSPNYPGVYPRNVTCRYRVRERRPPAGKHAMLAVRQTNSHKIHIKDQIVKYDRSQRVLRVWDQCNVVQDYLTVFDGNDEGSPILVRLCGGDAVPEIVSSGPHMLLEFHTSPFDNPFHPVPLSYLPGFELEVQVIYVDVESHSYVREPNKCEFLLTTFDAPSGVLENPRHSLPPNTTCRYHFQGRPHEVVWLSFVKYHAASADPAAYDLAECNAQLRVWDGRVGGTSTPRRANVTVLGEFCKDEAPRLCDHTLLNNRTRSTRPCSMAESYVSSGPEMTIEHFVRQGSALYPVSFVLKYEFVDVSLEGNQDQHSQNPCDRVFRPGLHRGRFTSPHSTFLYGRGGQQNISCMYRFEAGSGERVKLTFTKMAFGNKECYARRDPRSARWRCDRYKPRTPGLAQLTVGEYPWPGIYLPRDCLCTNSSEPLIITTLTAQTVVVNFTVTQMNMSQDFKDFYFEAEYEFVGADSEAVCASAWGERRLRGSSGEIALRSPDSAFAADTDGAPVDSVRSANAPVDQCVHQPWLIEPEDPINNYLYLKIRGYELSPIVSCPTSNRIMVYSAINPRSARVICPAVQDATAPTASIVEVFSDGWSRPPDAADLVTEHSRSFIIEFLQKEPGNYMVTWIEVSKRPSVTSSSSFTMTGPADCPYRCPELNACISSSLWCDGLSHCPSGFDEQEVNCAFQFGLPMVYIVTGAACLAFLAFLIALTACIRCCQNRRREKKKMLAQLANRNNHLHINHLHHSNLGDGRALRYHPTTEDLFLDGKDSLC